MTPELRRILWRAEQSGAVVYLRVSTREQADSGLGLEAQESACRAAAQRLGVGVVGPYVDAGAHGDLPPSRRDGLADALGALGRGDVLLVGRRDRLARSTYEIVTIERMVVDAGARIVSAAGEGTEDDSPESVLMRRILDAMAEYELLRIRARTRAAMRAKAARGEYTGGRVPVCRLLDERGRLSWDEAALRGARVAAQLQGWGWSLRRIGAELHRLGHAERPVHHDAVRAWIAADAEYRRQVG